MQLNIEKFHTDTGAVVCIHEKSLDAGNVDEFKRALQPVMNEHLSVLLDMGQFTFVDSSGLSALLACLKTMNNKEGQLKLFAMNKPVRSLFEMVRMHRIFAIYNTRDEAVAAC